MIRFERVNFQYADSEAGVTDICLHVRKGECVVLTGPSGNGRTTLIRLVNGLAPAFYTGRFSGGRYGGISEVGYFPGMGSLCAFFRGLLRKVFFVRL